MNYYVTVTSQGQISIPAKARKKLGIKKNTKLLLTLDKDDKEIKLQPAPDVLNDFGKLKYKAIKDKNIDEVIKLEQEGIEEAASKKYIEKKDSK